MELYSKEWSLKIQKWRRKFLRQVSHLPLLPRDLRTVPFPAVELVEITVCGEVNTKEKDCGNYKNRKPIVFKEWRDVDVEDGGGQRVYETTCGKFVRMTVYVVGRVLELNDTYNVIYSTVVHEDKTPCSPTAAFLRKINAENIAKYKILRRYGKISVST